MKQTILILTLTFLINTLVNAQSCVIAKSFTGHKDANSSDIDHPIPI